MMKKQMIDTALNQCNINRRSAVKLFNIIKYGKLTCELCKEVIPKNKNDKSKRLSYDHIIPKSKGGNGNFENLQIAHRICNARKGNKVWK